MATYSTVYTKLFSNSTVQCRAVQYNFNWPKLTGHLVYTLLSTVYKPYTTVQCSIHGIWLTLYTDRSWGGGDSTSKNSVNCVFLATKHLTKEKNKIGLLIV